jgi:hypothetical protein
VVHDGILSLAMMRAQGWFDVHIYKRIQGIPTWRLELHRELRAGFMAMVVQRGHEEERR